MANAQQFNYFEQSLQSDTTTIKIKLMTGAKFNGNFPPGSSFLLRKPSRAATAPFQGPRGASSYPKQLKSHKQTNARILRPEGAGAAENSSNSSRQHLMNSVCICVSGARGAEMWNRSPLNGFAVCSERERSGFERTLSYGGRHVSRLALQVERNGV